MKTSLAAATLEAASSRVAERIGLHYPPSRWIELERAFGKAAKDLGFGQLEECVEWFLTAPGTEDFVGTIAGYFTMGETYFFREGASFDAFEGTVLPDLVEAGRDRGRRLRIWSAGCATGEEPYSIAIAIHKRQDLLRDWNVSIVATDINQRALQRAVLGSYREWSFRNVPASLKKDYFLRTGPGEYCLIPEIRRMVEFRPFNLVQDAFPPSPDDLGEMDVIFCRNVLMYFTPASARETIDRFRQSLRDGGWLFVSACEVSDLIASRFVPVEATSTMLYRRRDTARAPTWSPRAPADKGKSAQSLLLSTMTPESTTSQAYVETREDARLRRCRALANEGRLVEALTLAEGGVARDKLDTHLHCLRASILQELGEVDEAISSLRRALYIDPNLAIAHYTLGNMAFRERRKGEARRHFAKAQEILGKLDPAGIVAGSNGMTVAQLATMLRSTSALLDEGRARR